MDQSVLHATATSGPESFDSIHERIAAASARQDLFGGVLKACDEHRAEHACNAYPSEEGPTLGILAAAMRAKRILEIGCGLGYSTLWLAHSGGTGGRVETIERDSCHVEIARRHFEDADLDVRITILDGEARQILPQLSGPYDLVFVDGDVVEYCSYLSDFQRLVRPDGVLVSSNLFYGQYQPEFKGYVRGDAYQEQLLKDKSWFTVFLPNGAAVSIRQVS